MSTDHAKFMTLAIEESRNGLRAGERPFGAVVVRGDEIVALAHSVVGSSGDPTAHAETSAVRAATARLKSPSLAGCTLYTSCDPCPMCAGAIFNSQIDWLVIGASSHALMRLTGATEPDVVALTEDEREDLLFGVKVELTDATGMLKAGLPVTVRIPAAQQVARP